MRLRMTDTLDSSTSRTSTSTRSGRRGASAPPAGAPCAASSSAIRRLSSSMSMWATSLNFGAQPSNMARSLAALAVLSAPEAAMSPLVPEQVPAWARHADEAWTGGHACKAANIEQDASSHSAMPSLLVMFGA
eukprot:366282-Chlamydomonas_euryale.AAC.13